MKIAQKYNIPEHWDITGQITAHSDPESEFRIFKDHSTHLPSRRHTEWTGNEFTLVDFESYIESLKKNQNLENFS